MRQAVPSGPPTGDQVRFAELIGVVEAVAEELTDHAVQRLRADTVARLVLNDPSGAAADLLIDKLIDHPRIDWRPLRDALLAAAILNGGTTGRRMLTLLRGHCTDVAIGRYGSDHN